MACSKDNGPQILFSISTLYTNDTFIFLNQGYYFCVEVDLTSTFKDSISYVFDDRGKSVRPYMGMGFI